jgi:hypothetical protein
VELVQGGSQFLLRVTEKLFVRSEADHNYISLLWIRKLLYFIECYRHLRDFLLFNNSGGLWINIRLFHRIIGW